MTEAQSDNDAERLRRDYLHLALFAFVAAIFSATFVGLAAVSLLVLKDLP